ncbi:MAG: cytochrome P450 [Roseiflexaceae bacterium]
MDKTATQAASGLFRPDFLRDPFPTFTALREGPPIQETFPDGQRFWLLTRYQDVMLALRDRRFTTDFTRFAGARPATETVPNDDRLLARIDEDNMLLHIDEDSILVREGEEHARLRRLVSQAFTPRFVENMRPRIQQIADELLDAVQDSRQMDLLDDFAFPLPITVILEMLGVPVEERERCRAGSNALLEATQRLYRKLSHEQIAQLRDFFDYLRGLIAAKRAAPQDDLLSQLVQARDQADRLTEDELVSLVRILIVAGHETTVNLISLSMLHLLTHPGDCARLRAAPEQIPAAVEEMLRLVSVVSTGVTRYATEDIEVGGQLIRRGEAVMPLVGAANHDPAVFERPEQFDEARPDNRHLAFGHGIHYCLGAPLARLEGQIALATLLHRLPNLRLSAAPDALVWRDTWNLRGLLRMRVEF